MGERCFSCGCDIASNEMMIKNRDRNLVGLVQKITGGTLNQENWWPSREWNKFSVATTPVRSMNIPEQRLEYGTGFGNVPDFLYFTVSILLWLDGSTG